jgi:hypothetical protein
MLFIGNTVMAKARLTIVLFINFKFYMPKRFIILKYVNIIKTLYNLINMYKINKQKLTRILKVT